MAAPRILVIDDDDNFRTYCRYALGTAGLTCDLAANGRQALEMAAETAYDLLLLDIELPDIRGDRVLAQLRSASACRHGKAIVFSGGASPDEMAEMLSIGADDYLSKPFTFVQLLARVKAALRLKEAQDRSERLQRQLEASNRELEVRVRERTGELTAANEALRREIGERRLLHAQLVQAQKLESIGQLAAGIAHEINTPIQYIGDNTHFLSDAFGDLRRVLESHERLLTAHKDDALTAEQFAEAEALIAAVDMAYLNDEVPRAVEQTLQGVSHVAHIVRAVKEFSHPGQAKKTPVDLNHAIENTITIARNEWKYVAEVVTDLDASLPPVPCLPGELNQVLLNLLVNAAQAIDESGAAETGRKGTISVRTRRLDDHAEVRVGDTGGGIAESIRCRIFDPFFTTKPVGKGTGQGLAIAHAVVVKKHGGTITFETEVGRGTTFIIRLPLAEEAQR